MSNNVLDIRIQGQDYQVTCSPEEVPALENAVALLSQKMQDLGQKTNSTGQRLAVMTALNLAHELLTERSHGAAATKAAIDETETARRIGAMSTKLESVLVSANAGRNALSAAVSAIEDLDQNALF
jgi:cell division protein ZapA